ncbi:MAG: hypothetical protein ACTSO9_03260 [Candidatus Helarchaeota archaeon]
MEGASDSTTRQFVIAVIDDIYKWMEKISNSIASLNTSLDSLAENLLDQIVAISENFQTITNLVRSSRETQFKTVFNMFTKNMEAIEEIREIALSMTDQQKAITNKFFRTLERLQKKMYYADYQALISELKDLANKLKSINI